MSEFIKKLNEAVTNHKACNHSFLERVSTQSFSKKAWLGFSQQLYPHVHFFIPYMEELLLNCYDMKAKVVVATILLDEYGEDAEGESHPDMFRTFVKACGGQAGDDSLMSTKLDQSTISLVNDHMNLCSKGNVLTGMGVIGPAHEFAVTLMFPKLLQGMKNSGFTAEETLFFDLHVEHDVEHSQMFDDTISNLIKSEQDEQDVWDGCMASLAARDRLWTGMEKRMVAIEEGREPESTDTVLVDLTREYRTVPDFFWPNDNSKS